MKPTRPNRRNFLAAATLGSAGVAAAVVAGTRVPKEAADAAAAGEEKSATTAYRETAHIRKYYKTTAV